MLLHSLLCEAGSLCLPHPLPACWEPVENTDVEGFWGGESQERGRGASGRPGLPAACSRRPGAGWAVSGLSSKGMENWAGLGWVRNCVS